MACMYSWWIIVAICCLINDVASAPVSQNVSIHSAITTEPTDSNIKSFKYSYRVPGGPEDGTDSSMDTPIVAAAVLKGCTLHPENEDVTTNVRNLIAEGVKLIKYHLSVPSMDMDLLQTNHSHLYKPASWIRTTSRHGQALLLLRPEYDALSLTTLSLGVIEMNVSLVEYPPRCLTGLSPKEVEIIIRELVMNDFKNISSGELGEHQLSESVCNMHIIDTDGWAEFRYICCNRNEMNVEHCNYLQTDVWLNVLFVVITLLKVIAVLFSPKLIPDSVYRMSHVAAPYIHKLEKVSPVKLRTVLTKQPFNFTDTSAIIFKLSKFKYMPNFIGLIQRMVPEVPYDITLNEVCLRIKRQRLLPEDYAPVSLLSTLYESFFKCKIRERESIKECCTSNFMVCGRPVLWYRVLKNLMKFLIVIMFVMPWVIRVLIYFQYEHAEMHLRKIAANERHLRFTFPGSLTLLLTPVHAVFVFIYILLCAESFLYGVLHRATKDKMKFVLRRCFRDMREGSKSGAVGWAVRTCFKPCSRFGWLGLCSCLIIWPVLAPVVFVVLAFYIFPSVNLTLRLLAHLLLYLLPRRKDCHNSNLSFLADFFKGLEDRVNKEHVQSAKALEESENDKYLKTSSSRCFQLVVIVLCLISLYSVLFLITELVAFVVEIFMYTLIGLILNASNTLRYISLILLLSMYANDCFGFVSKYFLAFNKTMNNLILGLGKDKVEEVIYEDEDIQINRSFRIRTDRLARAEVPIQLVKNHEGYPRWRITRLLLFLSKRDIPLVPRTFFFQSCKMPFYAVPGELLMCYLRAATEFGCIVMFLLFVLVVVLAFGDTYGLSGTNQLLATVAGGFVPFMLRKLVFKAHDIPTVDTSSIHFQVCLNKLLDTYKQSWPIFDITAAEKKIAFCPIRKSNSDNKPHAPTQQTREKLSDIETADDAHSSKATIDLVIDISKIDEQQFPGLQQAWNSNFDRDIGSTSLLDDFDDFNEADGKESSKVI